MYAWINNRAEVPLSWQGIENLWRMCQQHIVSEGYTVTFKRKVFGWDKDNPEIRCELGRWTFGSINPWPTPNERKYEVILDTAEPEQMEAALVMILSELKSKNPKRLAWQGDSQT